MKTKKRLAIFQSSYLSRAPVERALRSFVASHVRDGHAVLDLGCGKKPYQTFFQGLHVRYVGSDIDEHTKADVIAPNWKLPFQDAEFDVVFCRQVLEHTEFLEKSVDEIERILKPGGALFVSVPHAMKLHGEPHDYWRFTIYGLRSLFSRFSIQSIQPTSTYFSSFAQRFAM